MPAIQEEIARIVTIVQTQIPEDKLLELLIKLDEEIGKKSENGIIKEFLSLLRTNVDKPVPPAPKWLWAAFYVLVVLHIILILGVISSFFILPFSAPWYIALPVMTFIWFFSTTKVDCKLTNLENTIRQKLGLKRIGGFVGFYFLRPTKKLIMKLFIKYRSRNRTLRVSHNKT